MIKVKLKSGESLSSNNNYCELDYDVWVSLCQGKATEIKEVNKYLKDKVEIITADSKQQKKIKGDK